MKDIKIFGNKKIRSYWDNEKEKWYFSIIDVIEALTGTDRPRKYWNDLKAKLIKEGSELSAKIGQLKMQAEDGKSRLTDVADTEQLFRLIQSIPSPNAEPFKQWLAQTGYERVEESQDPEKSIDRAMENYLKLGFSKKIARKGGEIAGDTRKQIEMETGKKIVSPLNAKNLKETKDHYKLK